MVKSSVKSDVLPKAQATQKYATKRIAMQLNYSSSHSSNEGSEPRNEKIVIYITLSAIRCILKMLFFF